jgi:hypothetical protein
VLKTTTNSNTNLYHPNTAIGDDICLLHVSLNSTFESLPLQLYSQPLTSNNFPAILTVLVTFPAIPLLLILSLPYFLYKKSLTPIGPFHFKLLLSSLDLDLAIWFLLLIQQSESLASFFSRSRSSYGAKNRSCRVQAFAFLSSSASSIS